MEKEKTRFILYIFLVLMFTGLLVWNIILRERNVKKDKRINDILTEQAAIIKENTQELVELRKLEKERLEGLKIILSRFDKTYQKIDAIKLKYDTIKSNYSDTAINNFWDGLLTR